MELPAEVGKSIHREMHLRKKPESKISGYFYFGMRTKYALKTIDKCVCNAYNIIVASKQLLVDKERFMKRNELIKSMETKGYKLVRHGAEHDIYSDGNKIIPVPRHREINEMLAKKILRDIGR